jgi:hypothetical protein
MESKIVFRRGTDDVGVSLTGVGVAVVPSPWVRDRMMDYLGFGSRKERFFPCSGLLSSFWLLLLALLL